MIKTLWQAYCNWRYKKRMEKIRKLILKNVAPEHKLGGISVSKDTGTVFKVKDIFFDLRKNRIDYRYTKVRRGI